MRKRIISSLAVLVFVINLFTINISAAGTMSVTVGNASGKSGDVVEIPVVLSDNSGFSSLGVEIGYNETVLELINVTSSSVGATFTSAPNYSINPYNMSWDSASNIGYNGTLVTLSFRIVADKGGVYPVTVDYYKGRNGDYADGEDVNYDENFDPLSIRYVSGAVTVKSSGGGNGLSVSGISFGVSLKGDTNIGTVYAALYSDDGVLKIVKAYPAMKNLNVSFEPGQTGAYAKIMWWDENMKPMCVSGIIPLK